VGATGHALRGFFAATGLRDRHCAVFLLRRNGHETMKRLSLRLLRRATLCLETTVLAPHPPGYGTGTARCGTGAARIFCYDETAIAGVRYKWRQDSKASPNTFTT
jgi:hypothetical protein